MTKAQLETCGNCGATIGALETPYVWKQNVVCPACHGKLAGKVGTAIGQGQSRGVRWIAIVVLIFLVVIAGVGAVVWLKTGSLIGDRTGINSTSANGMAAALCKLIDETFEQSLNVRRDPIVRTTKCKSTSNISSLDIQTSPSEEYPKVVKLIVSQQMIDDTTYFGVPDDTTVNTQWDYTMTMTIGRKEGKWKCLKAEQRLEDHKTSPEISGVTVTAIGTVIDVTDDINKNLEKIP